MADKNAERKRIETYMLAAARNAGVPIPSGEIPGEEPDFRFQTETGALGIELSELLRPASSNDGTVPVEEESFHREIIEAAQLGYYAMPGAKRVHVNVYFTKASGKKLSKRQMAEAMTAFVNANAHRANPAVTFMQPETPDWFDSITIIAESSPSDWWGGECGGITLSEIRSQLAARISAKDKLVPTYRSNLPTGAHLWLLLYSHVTVPRSIPIPHGIEEWKFRFLFDRVFWFTSLEGQFAEIQRAPAGADS